MSDACRFPLAVRHEGKWGFITGDGRFLRNPPSFENLFQFVDGFAAVMIGGKWGIIDDEGSFVVGPRFQEMSLDEGSYKVALAGRTFWIDTSGREVPQPDRPNERRRSLQCGPDGGTVIGKEAGEGYRWGIADASGAVVIEPKYRAISCFRNGLAWVPFDDRHQWCPIDRHEIRRQNVACLTNYVAEHVSDTGPEKFSDDPYESGVLWMRAKLDYGIGRRETPPRMVSGNRF
jgi:hypothetical protein